MTEKNSKERQDFSLGLKFKKIIVTTAKIGGIFAGIMGGLTAIYFAIALTTKFFNDENMLRHDIKILNRDMMYVRTGVDKLLKTLGSDNSLAIEVNKAVYAKVFEERIKNNEPLISGTYFASPGKLFIINRDGTKKKLIPFDGMCEEGKWSPVMQKIVFQGQELGNNDIDIYIYDSLTDEIERLTENQGHNLSPVWLPSGRGIVFCTNRKKPANRKDHYDLYKMDIDGKNPTVILRSEDVDLNKPKYSYKLSICLPSICPNEKCISFSTKEEGSWDLWLMRNDKSKERRRVSKGWGYCRMQWNPANSKEVVYARDRRDVDGAFKIDVDIIVAELDTEDKNSLLPLNNKSNLTKIAFADSYPICDMDNFPDWSYDGRQIVFASRPSKANNNENAEFVLYVMNKDGSSRTELSRNGIFAMYPDW